MGLAYDFRNFVHYHQGRNMVVNRYDTGAVAESYIFIHWQVRGRGEEEREGEGRERRGRNWTWLRLLKLQNLLPVTYLLQYLLILSNSSIPWWLSIQSLWGLLIQTIIVLTSGMTTCHQQCLRFEKSPRHCWHPQDGIKENRSQIKGFGHLRACNWPSITRKGSRRPLLKPGSEIKGRLTLASTGGICIQQSTCSEGAAQGRKSVYIRALLLLSVFHLCPSVFNRTCACNMSSDWINSRNTLSSNYMPDFALKTTVNTLNWWRGRILF